MYMPFSKTPQKMNLNGAMFRMRRALIAQIVEILLYGPYSDEPATELFSANPTDRTAIARVLSFLGFMDQDSKPTSLWTDFDSLTHEERIRNLHLAIFRRYSGRQAIPERDPVEANRAEILNWVTDNLRIQGVYPESYARFYRAVLEFIKLSQTEVQVIADDRGRRDRDLSEGNSRASRIDEPTVPHSPSRKSAVKLATAKVDLAYSSDGWPMVTLSISPKAHEKDIDRAFKIAEKFIASQSQDGQG